MIQKCLFSILSLLPLYAASAQDFGRVLFYSGLGFNQAFGEIGSQNFNRPSGVARPGYKIDLFLVEYQFKNGFGVGLKSSISIHAVDNQRIEAFLTNGGAVHAKVKVENWIYEELSFQAFRTLYQTYNNLLVLSLGIGQAVVNKPEEYYGVTFQDDSAFKSWVYQSQLKRTVVGNTGLSYWVKFTSHFCIVGTIDYSHIPFRASFNTITENARKSLNDYQAPPNFQSPAISDNRPFTIYGLSAGIKLGFSF